MIKANNTNTISSVPSINLGIAVLLENNADAFPITSALPARNTENIGIDYSHHTCTFYFLNHFIQSNFINAFSSIFDDLFQSFYCFLSAFRDLLIFCETNTCRLGEKHNLELDSFHYIFHTFTFIDDAVCEPIDIR
jgi:hypothetical protein